MKSCILCLLFLLQNIKGQDFPRIRLAGGIDTIPNIGRVEVYYLGEWGTVCDDGFDTTDGSVVCRQLGYALGAVRTFVNVAGDDPILLDDVACEGYESAIWDCPHSGWSVHNCLHSEDVWVECAEITAGAVRLANGASSNEGRVEVYYDGEWGTVCDDSWDLSDGNVVCKQLGFAGATDVYTDGAGEGPILMDMVACNGFEDSLADCTFRGWRVHDCSHGEDAGVICSEMELSDTRIRLADGASFNQGRVEVYYDGVWGTICDDFWDLQDGNVACMQLGFPGATEVYTDGGGEGEILMDDLGCYGNEFSLAECSFGGWRSNDCTHSEDAGVVCSADLDTGGFQGKIRLVNGGVNAGRVETYYNSQWGTICSSTFGEEEGSVVCKNLGFIGLSYIISYGSGSGPILFSDLSCTGDELYLSDCYYTSEYNYACEHNQDVGVECMEAYELAVRLIDGQSLNKGRLEVFYHGRWQTPCSIDGATADVVCKQLGYTEAKYWNNLYLVRSGSTFDMDVGFYCYSSSSTLSDCDIYSSYECSAPTTSVTCQTGGSGIIALPILLVLFVIIGIMFCCCCAAKSKRNLQRNAQQAALGGATATLTATTDPATTVVHPPGSQGYPVQPAPAYPMHPYPTPQVPPNQPESPPPGYDTVVKYPFSYPVPENVQVVHPAPTGQPYPPPGGPGYPPPNNTGYPMNTPVYSPQAYPVALEAAYPPTTGYPVAPAPVYPVAPAPAGGYPYPPQTQQPYPPAVIATEPRSGNVPYPLEPAQHVQTGAQPNPNSTSVEVQQVSSSVPEDRAGEDGHPFSEEPAAAPSAPDSEQTNEM